MVYNGWIRGTVFGVGAIMTDKETVLAAYPSAYAFRSRYTGKFKVFYVVQTSSTVNSCWIALSASWDTEAEAWADAAAEIKRRSE